MPILDKIGRDITEALAESERRTGTPQALTLAAAILATNIDPLAESWGIYGKYTAEAVRARTCHDGDTLACICRLSWPEIRFGYGLCRINHPIPGWIGRNLGRLRTRYILNPVDDLSRLALAMDGCLALVQRDRSPFDSHTRALLWYRFGRAPRVIDILNPARDLELVTVKLARRRADRMITRDRLRSSR